MNLKDMVSGALQQKFQNSFERVMENMQDENTPYKDKRQITITMTFVQNEQRDDVVCDIAVKEKLAMQGGLKTQFSVGKDLRTGKVVAEEYGNQLKGQMSMDDAAENIAAVDMETGEISEDVIDIRKAK
ncbi:MAG: hypothetical protein V8Q42_11145 [Anaerovoracaceae bacterium]